MIKINSLSFLLLLIALQCVAQKKQIKESHIYGREGKLTFIAQRDSVKIKYLNTKSHFDTTVFMVGMADSPRFNLILSTNNDCSLKSIYCVGDNLYVFTVLDFKYRAMIFLAKVSDMNRLIILDTLLSESQYIIIHGQFLYVHSSVSESETERETQYYRTVYKFKISNRFNKVGFKHIYLNHYNEKEFYLYDDKNYCRFYKNNTNW